MAGDSSVLGSVFADIGKIQSKLNSLSDKTITINVDTKKALSNINGLTDSINNLRNIAIEPIKITIDIDQAKLQDIQNTITAIQQQAQNTAKGMANTAGTNAAAKAQQQAQQQAQQVAKEAAKQAQQIAQQFNQKVNASGKPYKGMTSVISVDKEEVKTVQKLNEALGQTRTIATDLKSGHVTEKMTTDYEKMAKEQDRINKFFSNQKMTYDNLMSGISKQNPLQGDFFEAAKKSLEDYRTAYESVEQQVRSGEALDLSKITRVREALQATSNAIKEQYAGQKQSLADQLQLDKAGQQVSKLKTQVEELFSKSFNRNNPLSGDFAKPVTDKFTELRTTLENLGNLAGSGDTSKIQEVTQGVRDAVTAYKELDTLRRNQQSAQWQSNQLSATDITAQIPILKNQVTLLQNDLDKLGFGEHFKSQVDGLKETIKSLSADGGSTQSFFSQMRQLKSDIEVFKEKPLGKGLMESVSISDNQLSSIRDITKLLNMQQSNESIVAAKKNLQDLANEYQNIQRQLQSPKIGNARYNDLLGREGRLDQQLKEYEAMSKHLSGGPASQDWIAQQETSIERLRAKYAQYQNEIGKTIQLTPELQSQMDSLSETFNRQGGIDILNWKSVEQQFSQLQARVEQFKASTQGMASQLATGISGTNLPQIDGLIDKLNNVDANYSGAGVQNMIDRLNDLKTQYQDVMTQLQSPNLTQDQFTGLADKVKELQEQFKQLADKAKIFNDGIKSDEALTKYETNLGNVTRKFEDLKTRYADLAKSNPQIAAKFDEVGQAIANTDPTNIRQTSDAVNDLGRACASAAGQTGGLRGALESAFGGFGSYLARFTSAYFVITKTIQGIKSMVNEVKAVDTSMVELQKVTNLSGESLTQFSEKSYEIGRGLGRTGKDVMDAVTTFSRAGYDLNEATQLAQSALVMTNVGVDIQNTEQAASDMISILKAYEIQASESAQVIDELYNVANKEPLDFGNITEMLVTAGGTLHQTGTDLEETMGLLTGAFATMRDTSVANGLIMISQRLRGVKEDGEAIEEEGFMPKLKDAFGNVGVQIEDSNGELRSTYDILHDLAGVWDSLSSKQKQFLGEKAAGNRQVKTLNAIMQNWEIVEDTIDKANEAQGAATVGNEKYLDSIQGRIVQLKTAFQELATETISSDFVKCIVSVGTNITKLVTNIGGLVPVLTTVLGIVTALKAAKIASGLSAIGKAIAGIFTGVSSIGSVLGIAGIIAAIAGIALAIGNATGAFESAAAKTKKAADASKKAYSDQKETVEKLNAELENTQARISELEGKKSLTVIEQAELDRLRETNEELRTLIQLEEARLGIKKREEVQAVSESLLAFERSSPSGINRQGVDVEKQNKALGVIATKTNDPGAFRFANSIVGDITSIQGYIKQPKTLIEEVSNAYKSIDYARQQYLDSQEKQANIAKQIAAAEEENDSAAAERLKGQYELQLAYTDYFEVMYQDRLAVLNDYYDKQKELLGEQEYYPKPANEYENNINRAIGALDIVGKKIAESTIVDAQTASDYVLGLCSDSAEKIREIVEQTGEITTDQLKSQFPEILTAFDQFGARFGISAENAAQHLTEKFYQEAVESGRMYGASLEEIAGGLIKNSEGYETLTKAITEQEKAGALSYATWSKLLATMPEMQKFLELTAEGYVLNTEAMYDYIKSEDEEQKMKALQAIMLRQEAIKELTAAQVELKEANDQAALAENMDRVNALQQEIEQYKALIGEINAATGALARFKAAQATPNQDQEFNEGKKAYDAVKEGNKTGKIGTDDYKTGMDYLLGEGWSSESGRFGGDPRKAAKEAERVGKRYMGQKTESKGMENFFKDLEKNGFADYDAKTGAFNLKENEDGSPLHTVEEMAAALGTSADLVKGMFGLAETYGYDFTEAFLPDEGDLDRMDVTATKLKESNDVLEDQTTQREKLSKALEQAKAEGKSGEDTFEFNGEQISVDDAEAKLNELDQLITETKEEIATLQEGGKVGVDVDTVSISDALDMFEKIQGYIDNGFPITFSMQGDYVALKDLLTQLGLLPPEQTSTTTFEAEDNTEDATTSAEENIEEFNNTDPEDKDFNAEDDTREATEGAKGNIEDFNETDPEGKELTAEDEASVNVAQAMAALALFALLPPPAAVPLKAEDDATGEAENATEAVNTFGMLEPPAAVPLEAKDDTATGINSANSRITRIFGDGAPYQATLEADDQTEETGLGTANEKLSTYEETPHNATIGVELDGTFATVEQKLQELIEPKTKTITVQQVDEDGNPISESEEEVPWLDHGHTDENGNYHGYEGTLSYPTRPGWDPMSLETLQGELRRLEAIDTSDMSPEMLERYNADLAETKRLIEEINALNVENPPEENTPPELPGEGGDNTILDPIEQPVEVQPEEGAAESISEDIGTVEVGYTLTPKDGSEGQPNGKELLDGYDPLYDPIRKALRQGKAGINQDSFFGQGGTLDLSNRKVIPSDWLADAGYDAPRGEIATLFQESGRIGENAEVGVTLTPILPNGDVVEPSAMDTIWENLFLGPSGKPELPSSVEEGLGFSLSDVLVNAVDLTGVPEDQRDSYMEALNEALHQVQQKLYEGIEPMSLDDLVFGDMLNGTDGPEALEVEVTAEEPAQPYNEAKEAAESGPPVEIPYKLVKEDDGGEGGNGGNGDGVDPSDFSYVQLANTADRTGEMLTNGIAQAKGNTQQIKDAQSSMRDFLLATNDYNNPVEGATPDFSALQSAADDVIQKYDALKATMGEGFEFDAETQTVLDKIEEIRTKAEEPVVMPIKPEEETPDVETPEPGNVDGGTVSYSADTTQVTSALNSVDTSVDIDVSSNADSVSREIDSAAKDRSTTITVNYKTTGTPPTGFATGTKNAKGGPALVDDGGGAELIEHVKRGTFELGTNSGPRLTTLDKGDVVHTAEETKKIMSRLGKVGGFFRNGLNKAKSILTGGAFGTGVTGGGSGAWKKVIDDVRKTSGSKGRSSSGSTGGSSTKKWKAWLEKLFDWAEIRLDRLKRITETWLLSAAEAIGYIAKNKELNGALESINDQIEQTSQAYDLYMKQAGKVQKKLKLSDKLVEKIQKGDIEISSYSKEKQEKIRAYQEWFWPQSHFE